jgi:pilus assembly protein Flp/PilA
MFSGEESAFSLLPWAGQFTQGPHASVAEGAWMKRIMASVHGFAADDTGAALAEYGILVAFIAIVAIVAVTFFGSKISAKFSELSNSFS